MMNENLLYLVILILVVIVLFFYLFRLEKFTALSQEEYDKTRDYVLEEVEKLLEGQLDQEGNQPNEDLKKYYARLKENLETLMDETPLTFFRKHEQELIEIQDFLEKNNNSE